MKLLHFADLHLDSHFAWLAGQPKLAQARRQGLRDTLDAIVRLAIAEGVDALLCGGDLYEQERWTPDTAAYLRSLFARLAPLPVFIAPGNHDWLGPSSLYQQTEWSPNVHLFQADALEPITLIDGLTLWGAAHRAPANTAGFLDRFRVDRGGAHLALFHGSERGFLDQQESGKQPHAPFGAEQLEQSGLHHALLGHYHRPRSAARHTYPGNPDPLTFGEDGQRGAVLLTLQSDGSLQRSWHAVNATVLHELHVDLTPCASSQDVRELIAEQTRSLDGFIQITLEGDLNPSIDLAPAQLTEITDVRAVIVRVGRLQVAYQLERIAQEPTVRGQFVRDVLHAPDLDDDQRQRVIVTGLRALDGRTDLDVG